jgi:hypothetical protein
MLQQAYHHDFVERSMNMLFLAVFVSVVRPFFFGFMMSEPKYLSAPVIMASLIDCEPGMFSYLTARTLLSFHY